jgi:hypothetical protein
MSRSWKRLGGIVLLSLALTRDYWGKAYNLPMTVETYKTAKLVTCKSAPPKSSFFYPLRFWKDAAFELPNLKRNEEFLMDNYMILGDPKKDNYSVYYHIHKAGGTTVQKANFSVPTRHLDWETKREVGPKQYQRQTSRLIRDIDTSRTAILFTFIRDPAMRFLSGIGQLLSMPHRFHKLGSCRYKKTTVDLLHCILDKMERDQTRTQTFLDPHLVPQVYELYSAVQQRDIPIQLLGLDRGLDWFLESCTVTATKTKLRSQTSGAPLEHFPQFRITPTLLITHPALLKRICKLYVLDVYFLQELSGLVHSKCMDVPYDDYVIYMTKIRSLNASDRGDHGQYSGITEGVKGSPTPGSIQATQRGSTNFGAN